MNIKITLMKKLIYLSLVCLTFSFFSCTEEIPDAVVDYYFSITPSDDFGSIRIDLSHIRAHQKQQDEVGVAMRSVYLDTGNFSLHPASNNLEVFIGDSSIEPSFVNRYDLNFGAHAIIVQNYKTRLVKFASPNPDDFDQLRMEIGELEKIKVVFELDLDASRLEFVDGEETFFPVFKTIIEKEN